MTINMDKQSLLNSSNNDNNTLSRHKVVRNFRGGGSHNSGRIIIVGYYEPDETNEF